MKKIPTTGKPEKKLFNNELINVYQMTRPIGKIEFWKENNRTIFTFERLKNKTGKSLQELTIDEITTFIAEQPIHKLSVLSKSIMRNGVQVPLIIRDDGKLLDGNRRFFACHWLRMQCEKQKKDIPDSLLKIPVMVIRKKDISDVVELKILAEANFIPDLKITWSLDAQARSVDAYYNTVKVGGVSHDEAIIEVVNVFGITKTRVNDLLDALELTKKFIREGKGNNEKILRRSIIEEKFIYFWEFRNKAMKGTSMYKVPSELKEVRDKFFQLMALGIDSPFKNFKQVEPFVQAKRDKTAWAMLKKSDGEKLHTVVSLINEKKEVRKAEDKIRLFHAWLKDVGKLSKTAQNYLSKLKVLVDKKFKEKSS